ncbi:MAG: hypothetical protein HND39_16870 [Ignavibacteriota bacterium]|nr:MAG: hypothetical protein HND39_16870 [Ignavibacteriota bacterium]
MKRNMHLWMEGWAVMLPFDYMEEFDRINSRLISIVGNYEYNAGTENDLPAMISSFSMPYSSYRNSAYDRSSISYNILRNILGDELFLVHYGIYESVERETSDSIRLLF